MEKLETESFLLFCSFTSAESSELVGATRLSLIDLLDVRFFFLCLNNIEMEG
jgi:hypothetical protein